MGNRLNSEQSFAGRINHLQSPYQFSMSVPFEPTSVKIVRLVLAGIANHLNFSLDEIEDLKMAVGEIFNFLLKESPADNQHSLYFVINTTPSQVDIQISAQGMMIKSAWETPAPSSQQVTSSSILDFLIDDLQVEEHKSGSVIRLSKSFIN